MVRSLPDASKYVYATNTAPDGSFTVTQSLYGRVLEVTRKNSVPAQIGKTSYAYDTHGRQYQVTDARNGTTTTTYYSKLLQATNILYPDGTGVTNEYYLTGQLKKTSGSRTYPVEYRYDAQKVSVLTIDS